MMNSLRPSCRGQSGGVRAEPVPAPRSRVVQSEDEAIAGWIKALSDDNAEVREQAALALGRRGPKAKAAIRALEKALGDANADVRRRCQCPREDGGPPTHPGRAGETGAGPGRGAEPAAGGMSELADRFGDEPAALKALEAALTDAVCKIEAARALKTIQTRTYTGTTPRVLHTLKGNTSAVYSVVFSPDGKRLASASHDQTIKVWDAQTGQETLSREGGHSSVVFSPDGKRLGQRLR